MVALTPPKEPDRSDWWACACVKRAKGGLTHIKLHHPSVKTCRSCKCQRPKPVS